MYATTREYTLMLFFLSPNSLSPHHFSAFQKKGIPLLQPGSPMMHHLGAYKFQRSDIGIGEFSFNHKPFIGDCLFLSYINVC